MQKKIKFKTVEEYFASVPEGVRNKLEKIRQIIKEEAPEAQEVLSYQMPAFKLNGRILIYYAAWKEHIGFYPYPSAMAEFNKELVKYKTAKSTVRFPLDKPIPFDLISKIIKYRVKENLERKKNG